MVSKMLLSQITIVPTTLLYDRCLQNGKTYINFEDYLTALLTATSYNLYGAGIYFLHIM